jgi:putative transposase
MASEKFTKVIRLEIVKPVNDDWKTVGEQLRQLQGATCQALNLCMRNFYIKAGPAVEQARINDLKVSRQTLGITENDAYYWVKDAFSHLCSSYVYSQISHTAYQRFTNDWFKIMVTQEVSLPTYRRDCPICIRKVKDKKGNIAGIKLSETKAENGTDRHATLSLLPKGKSITFLLNNRSFREYNLPVWNRILSGDYDLGMAQLIYSKRLRKWFLNLSYSFEREADTRLDTNIRLGVDLGISVPVYLAIQGTQKRIGLYPEGETIENFRKQVESRRWKLRRNERKVLARRQGRGRKHKIAPIEKLQEKIDNFRRTSNHRLSKAVINFALEHGAGTIVMEDLKGFSEEHSDEIFLKNWTYHDLQSKIEYKAKENDISVEKINPQFTSQRCSKCGHIDEANRPTRDDFKCVKCGFKAFADHNAALNIATPNIENIISSSLNIENKG